MNPDNAAQCTCDLHLLELDGYSTIERVIIPDVSPAPLYWECAGCGRRWHRYHKGHPLRETAERYVSAALIHPQNIKARP